MRWINDYYDDMAWLALALERAGSQAGVERPKALDKLADQFLNAWVPEDGGGIPWRKQDQFFNAPANGPAGIFLARYDRLRRAQQMADWIDETLIDPDTHLVFDGIKGGSLVRAQYTYCQGVVLGLEVELAARTEDEQASPSGCVGWSTRSRDNMAPGGVIQGAGGGDGGLFNGITGALPGAGRPPAAGGLARGHRGARHRQGAGAEVGPVGVGLPAERRRASAVRGVLGPQRRPADARAAADAAVRRGRGQRLGDPRDATCRCRCRAGC